MRKKHLVILLSGVLLFSLASCKKNSRFKINTHNNRVEVKLKRFDKDLLTIDTSNVKPGVIELYKRYPDFMKAFVYNILQAEVNDTATACKLIHEFLTDKNYAPIYKKSLEVYANTTDIETSVSDAYTYIHHYFPEVRLPDVYLHVSGFNRQIMMNDKFISMGIDFYLGNDFPLYPKMTYQYMIYNMRRENLASDLVSATLFRMFVMHSNQNRLLDNMLFRGKIMYLLSVVMPNEKDEILMGYSPEQWKWCEKYEKQIWMTIIDQKHLFSTDIMLIRKYMNDAPFTAPISQQSPGRLGTYMGWQIVKSYMKKNANITIKELMSDENYQKILENSGYKP